MVWIFLSLEVTGGLGKIWTQVLFIKQNSSLEQPFLDMMTHHCVIGSHSFKTIHCSLLQGPKSCTFLPVHCLGNAGNQLFSKTHHIPEGCVPQLQFCKNPKLAKPAFLYCCRALCFIFRCTFGSMILCWFSETMTSSISLRIRWSWGLMWNVSEIETFYISNSQGWNTKSLNTAVKGQNSCFLF